jgi:hypothetical protein
MAGRERPPELLVYDDSAAQVVVSNMLSLGTKSRSKNAQSQILFTPSFLGLHREITVVYLASYRSCVSFISVTGEEQILTSLLL